MSFRTRLLLTQLLILSASALFAQNLNTTFRSKISFPGQTLANVWGYDYRGKEYALVGASKGLIIVDISNPDAPQEIVQIPGPDNLWKEIKTYRNYAYITSEGGQGIQIVNLSDLPSAALQSHFYTGDGVIAGQLNTIHALHIDETKGFLYAWGGGLFGGAAKIFDLKADPYNPVYVGKFDQLGYIHDGYVDNDTMYSCHIYAGQFAVVNMADKSSPELINTQTTPNAFPHNTWLTPDRHTILATDETNNSFLSSWDVSDPTDIKFLDKIQSNPGSNSIVHNTYAMKNWAITSWYKDGFTIVDVTRPDNLIQVGNYDTYAASGSGFEGCWGVYPFFPSGSIIASNIGAPGELYILSPNYVRACYLEGTITDGITGAALQNAQIQVIGTNPQLQELSALNGSYKTGQEAEGYYKVVISKSGYLDFETLIYFQHGELILLDAALYPDGLIQVSGSVIRHEDGSPVDNATVWLYGGPNVVSTLTDATGVFHFNNIKPGKYDIAASAQGLGLGMLPGTVLSTNDSIVIELFQTYRRPAAGFSFGSEPEYLSVARNPFAQETSLQYKLPETGISLTCLNELGERMQTMVLKESSGQLELGAKWPPGTYFLYVQSGNQVLEVKKLVKY